MALSADHWCFGHRSWGNVFLRKTVWSIMRNRNFSYLKTPCPKSTCIARHRAFFVCEMPVGTLQQHVHREASYLKYDGIVFEIRFEVRGIVFETLQQHVYREARSRDGDGDEQPQTPELRGKECGPIHTHTTTARHTLFSSISSVYLR